MLQRREFLKHVLGAATAFLPIPILNCATRKSKPNIIYILADDLGYGDLGCYGQKEIQTPNIDKLANDGILFTDHYAGSTVCAPSRCCLMTGTHTGHARIRGNALIPLEPSDLIIAELLKKAGYSTALVGKWGLGETETTGEPNKKGFDYFFGYLNQTRAHNYYTDWIWRNHEKIKLDNNIVMSENGYSKGIGSASINKSTYSHDLFTREAQTFIDKNRNNPFFLYLAYTIPHANNQWNLVEAEHGMEVPDYGIYKDKNWPLAQKGHAAMISRMDSDIGKIVEHLQNLGLTENTVIMFSSDNGPHKEGLNDPDFNDSNGPLRGIKRDVYEGGIRVPFIAKWPGKIKPGTKSNHISAFWDLLPTCVELAGIEIPENIDGISFLPTLLGKSEIQKQHEYLYWEFHWNKPTRFALRMNYWKAVQDGPNAQIELFDLDSDLGETTNVANAHPDILEKVKARLEKAHTDSESWPIRYE